jgi:hypothetical protein
MERDPSAPSTPEQSPVETKPISPIDRLLQLNPAVEARKNGALLSPHEQAYLEGLYSNAQDSFRKSYDHSQILLAESNAFFDDAASRYPEMEMFRQSGIESQKRLYEIFAETRLKNTQESVAKIAKLMLESRNPQPLPRAGNIFQRLFRQIKK